MVWVPRQEDLMLDLTPATTTLTRLLAGLDDDQLNAVTPAPVIRSAACWAMSTG